MTALLVWTRLAFVALACLLLSYGLAGAQTAAPSASPTSVASPQASPAPSVSPAPTERPSGLRFAIDAHATFITQTTNGPGTQPLEAPGFIAGSPLAPNTPYDTISSAPLVPGNAGESVLYFRPTYYTKAFEAGAVLAAGYVRGSVTNAAYWGESLVPALNPHIGSQILPYRVTFPTHAGMDDGTGFVAGVTSGRLATADGNVQLRAGWFDLAQTDQFVFTQPLISGSPPAIAILPPESLGDGPPSIDWWTAPAAAYPLRGVDLVGKQGTATLELSDAALPSLPGSGARITMGSLVFDRGEGTRFSLQALHLSTGGALVPTTILYAQGQLVSTPQGDLPSTMIGGQRQTILGARGAFHVASWFDAVAEYGHATYDADNVMLPGTAKPGNYYHAGVSKTVRRATASFDVYRNEPRYASAILPYGIPENVWSAAWSWPGQWLKSNYQLINNGVANVNRQGYRAKYALKGGLFELRAQYANFGQIEPITLSNARQTGFIDGFFLPQADNAATLGRQHQYGLWLAWHPSIADLVVDYTEDTMHRSAVASRPQDLVSYDTAQFSIYASRRLGKDALGSLGITRYFMRGSFAQAFTNVDFGQKIAFAGLEWRETGGTATLLSVRRSVFGGFPSQLGGPPPDFTGTLFVLEQRFIRGR